MKKSPVGEAGRGWDCVRRSVVRVLVCAAGGRGARGLTGRQIPSIEDEYAGRGYGDFKKGLAEVVVNEFGPVRARALELLEQVGMRDAADRPSRELAYGDVKRVELAIAPRVKTRPLQGKELHHAPRHAASHQAAQHQPAQGVNLAPAKGS